MAAPFILVVDDEPDIRSLVQEILEDEGYDVEVAENAEVARKARRAHRPDLILLDIWMPDVDGITLLKEWMDEENTSPVIMMSGHGTVETAVEATRLGAYDFLEKPLSLAKLLLTVKRALEASKLGRENRELKRQVQPQDEPLGRSPAIAALKEQIVQIAKHDAWVLLHGEVGSGKSLAARSIHEHSDRKDGPFVEVGVAALHSEYSATELFGSEAGDKVHFGLLEQASTGTLYIDDIGDMDLATQARLLSALTSGSYHRVGGAEAVTVNVRVIAATHYDLEQLVQQEKFRSDLYYHLNVVPLGIPPLRDHREDIPELLNYYLDRFVRQERFTYRDFSMAAVNRLRNYNWPGNLLELKNLVQRLLISNNSGTIEQDEVERHLATTDLTPATSGESNSALASMANEWFDLPLREAREQFERSYLIEKLRSTDGSVGKVAQLAGMERTHLYRKLKSLEIDPKQLDES